MSGWQRVFLDDRKVPIMIKGIELIRFYFLFFCENKYFLGDEVIGYDDLQSMELKVRSSSIK